MNKKEIVEAVREQLDDQVPGWEYIDCGCCGGLQWGGDTPRECNNCNGTGCLFRHIKSGVLAQYPGGPFLGKEPK